MKFKIVETTQSRVLRQLQSDNWFCISACLSFEIPENVPKEQVKKIQDKNLEYNTIQMKNLSADLRRLGYGFIPLKSLWVENGEVQKEFAYLVPKGSKEDAITLGKKYKQRSVLIKTENKCVEFCTTPSEDGSKKFGDTLNDFDTSNLLNLTDVEKILSNTQVGAVSVAIRGKGKFTLKNKEEVEG